MRLKDKTAIVTGARSGIGLATVIRFLAEGANVIACDIKDPRKQIETITSSSRKVLPVRADVSLEGSAKLLIRRAVARYGRLDVLVNNAGIQLAKTVTETTANEWDHLMSINLKSVFLCSKAAISEMSRTGGGVIVNVASELGIVGANGIAAYCASKGGVILLTKAMAVDHASENIRINCVCPGPTDTPLLDQIFESSSNPTRERQNTINKVLLKRLGKASEIADAILFLSCEESSYMTGLHL